MVANRGTIMELLSSETLRVAFNVALMLTAMSAVVLAVIVAVRVAAQSEDRHAARFRRRAEPLVTAYLAGREKTPAVAAVLQQDSDRALPLLMEISDRLEPDTRAALRPLFTSLPLREKEAAALRHRRWERRMQAAERLGYLGDGISVPALLDALQDPVLAVRFAAARSLATIGEKRAIPQITLAFDLPGEMNQRRVAEILLEFGPDGKRELLDVLRNADRAYSDNAVGVAARVLGMLRATEASGPLTDLLGHDDFRIRLNAVRSLGLIGDRAATGAVAKLCTDPAWEVRNAAMQALGRLQAESCLANLTAALRDDSWWVRFSAAQALWELGQPGREALTTAMSGDSDRYARDMSRQVLEEHGALRGTEATA